MKKLTITATFVAALTAATAPAQERMSLTLEQCRQMALANSEDIQIAGNKQAQAEMDTKIASASALPSLEGSVSGVYIFPDMEMGGMETRMRGMYMAGLSLTQPIYAGGKISNAKKLSKIGREAAAEQVRMTRAQTITDADNAYWTYIAVRRKIAMLETICRQMDTLYRQTDVAHRAGMATGNDLMRIKAKQSEMQYQLKKVMNGAGLCRMSLCRVIGADYATQIDPADTIINCAEPQATDINIGRRPELLLLEKQVQAGQRQVKMANADRLPTVGLQAGYTLYGNIEMVSAVADGNGGTTEYSQKLDDGMGYAMLGVSFPIWKWNQNTRKTQKAKLDLQNAELELRKNSRLLSIEAQSAMQNMMDGYALIQSAQLSVDQAAENLRVMRNRYAASMSPLTDLLDAQTLCQQAESNLIEAQAQYKIYQTEYLRATGQLE